MSWRGAVAGSTGPSDCSTRPTSTASSTATSATPAHCKAIFSGDGETAYAGFTTAVDIGDRFGDIEISTLARIGVGRCLIYMGEVDAGVALLDEAMVSVGAREVSPIAVGDPTAR